MTIPSDKNSKKKSEDQSETKPLQEDGWCLTHTIQLSPDRTQQFLSFLEREETSLQKVAKEEEAERKRILGQVYSMILSGRANREQSSASIQPEIVQETKSVPRAAVSIPLGKYLTMAHIVLPCDNTRRRSFSGFHH